MLHESDFRPHDLFAGEGLEGLLCVDLHFSALLRKVIGDHVGARVGILNVSHDDRGRAVTQSFVSDAPLAVMVEDHHALGDGVHVGTRRHPERIPQDARKLSSIQGSPHFTKCDKVPVW